MSFFECGFENICVCFDPYSVFSLFEEIENAFIRSFLQGDSLKSDVLDMPVYCELPLELRSPVCCELQLDPKRFSEGKADRSHESLSDKIRYDHRGGSDYYFNNVSYSCFGECSEYGRAYNGDLAFGCVPSADAALIVTDRSGVSLPMNIFADGNAYFSPSLSFDMYGKLGSGAFPNFPAGAVRCSDISFDPVSCGYSNNGGCAGNISERIKTDAFVGDTERKYDSVIGQLCVGDLYFIGKGGDLVFAAGADGIYGGSDRSLGFESDFVSDRGLRSWVRFGADGAFAGGGSFLKGEREIIGAWLLPPNEQRSFERELLSDEKCGFGNRERLSDENNASGKCGLLYEQGKGESEAHLLRSFGSGFSNVGFDFMQQIGRRIMALWKIGASEVSQRGEFLWDKNVKAGFEGLGESIPASALSEAFLINERDVNEAERRRVFREDVPRAYPLPKMLPIKEREENTAERGRLLFEEDELYAAPEEIRGLRRAAAPKYCGEPVIAEIKVDMSGMKNIINKETDIDSIVADLTAAVSEAVASAAEGVCGL